jgi:hypothetical protein
MKDSTTESSLNAHRVKDHGPITGKDIKDKSGVSAGTISNYLHPKYGFLLVSRGLWDVAGRIT